MATFTKDVEVELSDFRDKDVISYVKEKMAKNVGFATEMKRQLSLSINDIQLPNETLNDRLKIDFLSKNWDIISIENLEKCLK